VNADPMTDKKLAQPKSHNNQNETCRSTLYFGEKINSFVLIEFTLGSCFPQFKQLLFTIVCQKTKIDKQHSNADKQHFSFLKTTNPF